MAITEKTFMNTPLRERLSKRIGTFGDEYLSDSTIENALMQLSLRDEYFCNLISNTHFSNQEIEAILEINIQ